MKQLPGLVYPEEAGMTIRGLPESREWTKKTAQAEAVGRILIGSWDARMEIQVNKDGMAVTPNLGACRGDHR